MRAEIIVTETTTYILEIDVEEYCNGPLIEDQAEWLINNSHRVDVLEEICKSEKMTQRSRDIEAKLKVIK